MQIGNMQIGNGSQFFDSSVLSTNNTQQVLESQKSGNVKNQTSSEKKIPEESQLEVAKTKTEKKPTDEQIVKAISMSEEIQKQKQTQTKLQSQIQAFSGNEKEKILDISA